MTHNASAPSRKQSRLGAFGKKENGHRPFYDEAA